MILQKIKPTIQPLEVGHTNRLQKAPQNGVCGIFSYVQACVSFIKKPLRSDFDLSLNNLHNSNSIAFGKSAKNLPLETHTQIRVTTT